MSIRHVIWDFNGTLLDDVDLLARFHVDVPTKRATSARESIKHEQRQA